MFILMLLAGLSFAYMSGMHDGGTVVATTISSRLETPRRAVVVAGIANFLGALLLGTTVAMTISEDIIDMENGLNGDKNILMLFIASSFLGSILWNVVTWIIKLPSSSSHGLIGSMIGCGIAAYGIASVKWFTIFVKVILAMLFSPLLGFAMGYLVLRLQYTLLKNGTMVWEKRIKVMHKASSFLLSFCYGSNDSQKVMGLLAIGLAGIHGTDIDFPLWIIICSGGMLAIGTLSGGYNMIKTVGMNICKINVDNSFASQVATILVLTAANITGLPISTIQVITSSVMGVGTGDTPKAVNWTVIYKILGAWFITIPAAALMGYIVFEILNLIIL